MKNLKIIYLALGVFLFLYFLSQTSVESLWLQVKKVSWGIIPIIFTYFMGFCCDALLWNLTLKKKINYSLKWLFHIWKVKMVGEAFNIVTPLATLGGEPIKIFILKKISKIPYKEGVSAFILTKTIVMISLILFFFVLVFLLPVFMGFIIHVFLPTLTHRTRHLVRETRTPSWVWVCSIAILPNHIGNAR